MSARSTDRRIGACTCRAEKPKTYSNYRSKLKLDTHKQPKFIIISVTPYNNVWNHYLASITTTLFNAIYTDHNAYGHTSQEGASLVNCHIWPSCQAICPFSPELESFCLFSIHSFTMHLGIIYMLIHSKAYKSRKIKITTNLKWMEYLATTHQIRPWAY